MENLIYAYIFYCSLNIGSCQIVEKSVVETTWYLCDAKRSNTEKDVVFIFDGKVITVKKECTGA